MPRTIELPSGGTCTILEVKELRSGEKRRVGEAMAESPAVTDFGLSAVGRVAAAAQSIIGWNLPYLSGAKVPRVDREVFDKLELDDYNAILEATNGYLRVLYPPPATPDDSDVPGSPTEPAGD